MILRNLKSFWTKSKCVTSNLTNQCTRIATARFYNGYALAKKWVIGATLASPQSRDFKRYGDGFARRHNGAADASAALRPSAGYRAFAPLRAITSG
jgi:hypothetical protein